MREAISRRHLFRREYRPLRSAVAAVIAQADPVNLLALGAPGDEYDGEVGAILPHLARARSEDDVRTIVRSEFVRRFGDEVAGPPERYRDAAAAIWRAVEENRRPPRS
jgi:hypothetical protein